MKSPAGTRTLQESRPSVPLQILKGPKLDSGSLVAAVHEHTC